MKRSVGALLSWASNRRHEGHNGPLAVKAEDDAYPSSSAIWAVPVSPPPPPRSCRSTAAHANRPDAFASALST